MSDGTGVTTYGYDTANRVTSITKGADTATYGYDAAGNVTSRTVAGVTTGASFDDAGQLAAVTDPGGITTYAYDRVGNVTGVVMANGVAQTRTFDRAGQLSGLVTSGPGGPVGGATYTRDGNGNPVSVDVSGPGGVIATESMRLTYDRADRLTRACFTTTTCTATNRTQWAYDTVGNRLSETVGATPVSTYAYNAADQLTAIAGSGAAGFAYNANGDQIGAGADVFTYNTARQLTGATVAGVANTYTYDGNANRTAVTAAGVTTSEVWDTNNALPTLVAERNGGGVVVRRYGYGVGGTPLRFDDVTASTAGYYVTDGLGSVTNVTNPTGNNVATYRYNPYGALRPATTIGAGYTANPLKFTGQQQDSTGQYNLRARHYNPTQGQFTQTDPMPKGPGNSYKSPYVYANDRPTVFVDPNGLRAVGSQLSINPILVGANANAVTPSMDSYCRGDLRYRSHWAYCLSTYLSGESVQTIDEAGPLVEESTGHGFRDVLAALGATTVVSASIQTFTGDLWKNENDSVAYSAVKLKRIRGSATATVETSPPDGTSGDALPSLSVGAKFNFVATHLDSRTPFAYVALQSVLNQTGIYPWKSKRIFYNDANSQLVALLSGKWVVRRDIGLFVAIG